MCRVIAYFGQPVMTENLLFSSDSSLINQVFKAQMLNMLNLAGFGMVAWDKTSNQPIIPWQYRSTGLPVFDRNLRALSEKLSSGNLLAHIRGVPTDGSATISEQNLHPFVFSNASLAMAHNGDLYNFAKMRFDLAPFIKQELLNQIRGNTDSEWIYALLMSCFDDYTALHSADEIAGAVQDALNIIRQVRAKHNIDISSSVNLFISNPHCIIAIRYAFDYGCYPLPEQEEVHQGSVDYLSLWYTKGSDYACYDGEWKMVGGKQGADSVIIASEPLSLDTSTWVEVPEYHLLAVTTSTTVIETRLVALD